MQCRHCFETRLVMAERHGIGIDYCPKCRGVWLDRGELEKILERAAIEQGPLPQRMAAAQTSAPLGPDRTGQPRQPDFADSDFGHHGHDARYVDPGRKRKSMWSESFDFD
ncbi:zf-TFIIB domain-containing protein [Thiomonas sp. X19]|uniref:TFIIB-type zinc ribbon-containing protein n=1 Tax=Thiomonas sp. X19 TaxID=1050370 RepID=UPI000DDB3AAE|nr:zf-TFIIB domain-containing protein [Thiomonas sp. X19]